jgi:protein subunit release factor A
MDEGKLSPEDLQIELCSSGWPHGGQHVGTLPTWVRITHRPTGLWAESRDERSQLQNKARALAELERKVSARRSAGSKFGSSI